ncbi:efflux RND transporter periplasmic adaptor subunit, partial [Brasilonema octagenarum]
KVRRGQRVSLKVASVPNRTFTGRIAVIGSVVEGETRVVPVKAEIDNPGGVLKPGMFAELEVLTNQTSTAILAIPNSAVVDVNGKKQVYVQNGNAFQATEVTLGQTSGDMVEVKTGLFEGDMIVTQRAPQLYAQSLRGGTKPTEGEEKEAQPAQKTEVKTPNLPVPLWLLLSGGGTAIAAVGFLAGRRTKRQEVPGTPEFIYVPEESANGSAKTSESPTWDDNHHVAHQEPKVTVVNKNTQQ